jgi:tetratricopeptide (TPR) repeat protein
MVEELVASLRSRIEAFKRGDASAVLDSQALVEATRLWTDAQAASARKEVPIKVMVMVGWLHGCRSQALPEDQGHDDRQTILDLFGDIQWLDPTWVPDQIRAALTVLHPPGAGPSSLANQATMILERARYLHPAAIDRALELLRNAVRATPPDHPDRAMYLANLGLALQTRFDWVGDPADLDAAITALRQAAYATPTNHSHRAPMLAGLGTALQIRFERLGNVADLHAAVATLNEAADATPANHTQRAAFLSNFGGALRTRFEWLGDLADLDAAIINGRAAVDAIPADSSSRAAYVSNLGAALFTRFERAGDLDDLNAAIATLNEAIAVTSIGDPGRAFRLSNLGLVLRARFGRVGDLADLHDAIAALYQAVEASPADLSERAATLCNLSISLLTRFGRVGDLADLRDAIAALRQAVDATPAGHPNLPKYLCNLGAALLTRFERLRDLADLHDAITNGRAAVDAASTDHTERTAYLINLGDALRTRFERIGDVVDAEEALGRWREAASLVTAPASARMHSGRSLGALAASLNRWPEAADGYAAAVELLPLLAWPGVARHSREQLLANWGGLAADAAASAIAAGQPERAVELLEQGRAVLWSQLLEIRTDLTTLHENHPDLAAKLDAARAALDRPNALPTGTDGPGSTVEVDARGAVRDSVHDRPHGDRMMPDDGADDSRLIDQRMALAREWDELVEQVRQTPGFEDFLRPPRIESLLPVAADGPVILVNVSRFRCDALVVTVDGVQVVELRELTAESATDRANGYLLVLHEVERTSVDYHHARRRYDDGDNSYDAVHAYRAAHDALLTAQQIREDALRKLMSWLWDVVAEPVLSRLGYIEPPEPDQPWPRVWWCPTGPLTLLPLHAAGHHTTNAADSPATVIDWIISSYTPTIRALLEARRPVQADSRATDSMLIVAVPDPADQPQLLSVEWARTRLVELFPEGRHTLLDGDGATPQEVLSKLPRHRWVHFSCHGDQNLADPSRGGLLLRPDTLTIAEISAQQYHGDFAFLAACKTATGGVTLPDEAITLATALHYTGYRHVIGTLWSVYDTSALEIADAVYTDLISEGGFDPDRAAPALHTAVRRMRDQHPDEPSKWLPFTHTGP